jgi:G:T/U-mismatch repair DNA glycosylase
MKTEQVNLRLEANLVASLEAVAKEESLDRGTVVRKLLWQAIAQRQRDLALHRYQAGEISLGRAAEDMGMSLWDLMDEVKRRGIAYPLTPEEVSSRIALLTKGRSKVADEGPLRYEVGAPSRRRAPLQKPAKLSHRVPQPGHVLLVGINPAPISWERGHYYQGKLGKRLWRRLERVGLLVNPVPGEEDDAFVAAGNGLCDLVERPTQDPRDLSREELQAGVAMLRLKVGAWKPGMVLFAFKQAAAGVMGAENLSPGPGPELEGVPTFLLSGPYSSREETSRIDALLRRALTRLRRRS